MGSTNRSSAAYVAEVTFGTTPASPALKALRVTSSTMKFNPKTVVSNEIRSDRQTTDLILTDADSAGDFGIELSFSAFDDMLEAGLQGAWSNNPSITVVTTDTEISDISATVATVVTPLGTPYKTGMLVFTGGFTTAVNNGLLARVVSSTATSITFPAATFTIEAAPIPVGAFLKVAGFQGASADITATATGLGSTALDFTTLGLSIGEWIKIGGDTAPFQFATAVLNSWARVKAVTATALTLDALPAGWTTDAGTGKTIQVFSGDFLTNSTTAKSFTIERQQQDLTSPVYEYFKGSQVDKISLSFRATQILTGTMSFIGTAATDGTTRVAGATDIVAPTFGVMNASSNVGRMLENGLLVGTPSWFQELGFDLSNNLAGQKAIGTLGSVGIRNGSLSISGKVQAYFGDNVLLDKAINNTQTQLMRKIGRTDGNRESYVIDLPAVKLTGSSDIPGKDQDRYFIGTYQAFRSSTYLFTCSIGRFNYLPVAN